MEEQEHHASPHGLFSGFSIFTALIFHTLPVYISLVVSPALLICVCSLSLLPTTAQPEDPALYLRPETIDIHEFGHSGPSPFICTVRKETKATSHSVEPHVRVTGEWCQAVCMCVTPRDYATVFSRLPFNSGKPLAFTTFSANFKSVG